MDRTHIVQNNKRNKNNRIIWMQILCINTDLEIPNWNMPCIWIRFSSENRISLQTEPSRNVLWNPIQPCFDLLLCFWNYFDLKSDKFAIENTVSILLRCLWDRNQRILSNLYDAIARIWYIHVLEKKININSMRNTFQFSCCFASATLVR